jgi:hypothetical protein
MKNLTKTYMLIIALTCSFSVFSQNTLSIAESEAMEKSADSSVCAAHNLLFDCFVQWNDGSYNTAILLLNNASSKYKTLLEIGTARKEYASITATLIGASQMLTDSDLMLYDKNFSETMKTAKKDKKMKYNGTIYYVPKSYDFLFERLTDKTFIDGFCK